MDEAQRSKYRPVLPSNAGDPRFIADDDQSPQPSAEWTDRSAVWADVTFHLGVGLEMDVLKLKLRALLKLVGAFLTVIGYRFWGLITRPKP